MSKGEVAVAQQEASSKADANAQADPVDTNRSVDAEGRKRRMLWIGRWVFFALTLVVGIVLMLGQMGQKVEHKKANVTSGTTAQSSDD